MTTIAFPTLTLAAPPSFRMRLISNTQADQSPLNKSVQTYELPGACWGVTLPWSALSEADASLLQGFLAQLRGRANRFTLGNLARPVPRGTIALSSVLVNGAVTQGATTVAIDGCGAGATLKIGDMFAVGGELKMVVSANVTANGSGEMATVTFEPPVRAVAGWANNAAVTTSNPQATFMLTGDTSEWETSAPQITDIAIDAIESFA